MASYPYQQLALPNETRILTVAPGKYDDDLICNLSHLPLGSDTEPYEALSYCWNASVSVDQEVDPDVEIMCAAYGREEDGTEIKDGGSIRYADLLNHPYFGSSYIRMGGTLPKANIVCDGVVMTIGGELHRALRRLRKEDQPLRLWADALCINQEDIQERNEHVKLMGQIYARAALVRIWLGEEIGIEMELFDSLMRIRDILTTILFEWDMLAQKATMHELQWQFFNNPELESIKVDWQKITEFLDRAWFRRTWVIQEIANAKAAMVHIGQFEVSWDFVTNVIMMLREYRLDAVISGNTGFKAVVMMEALRSERIGQSLSTTRMPFLTLLEELRDFKSTIGSDKIYGVLGLAKQKDAIAVDYAKSSEDAFTEFAVQQLRTGSLDVLTHCVQSSKPSTLNVPSWVPDWTRPGWVEPFRIRELRASAAPNTVPKILQIDVGRGTLQVVGRLLDRLAAIDTKRDIPRREAPVFEPPGSPDMPNIIDPAFRNARLSRQQMENANEFYRNIIDIAFPDKIATAQTQENLWRTFMCNRTRDNADVPVDCETGWDIFMKTMCLEDTGGIAQCLQDRVSHQVSHHGLPQSEADAYYLKEKELFELFAGAHSKWTYNRRFFRSEAGRFGWAVDGVEQGDVVALLYGLEYPFVLREEAEEESGTVQYRIVGDCYIHGLMDGEGLGDQFEETNFVLR